MNNGMNSYKKKLGFNWIKSDSGSTYLCPTGAFAGGDSPSENELQALCIEDSLNPQND